LQIIIEEAVMKKLFLFLITFISIQFNISFAQEVIPGSFEFEGYTRDYLVFLPPIQPQMPVVFNLHGYSEDAQWFMDYTFMNNVADTAGFIVVYPNAIQPGFNSGITDLPTPNVNDVGFISVLIDSLDARYDIDMSRIYCCGFSNGAHMSQKLSWELGYRFAAVASICGSMTDNTANNNFHFNRSIPIFMLNGTADPKLPYNGGRPGLFAIEQTLNFWIQNNNCLLTPDTLSIPDTCATDYCSIQKISYRDCEDSVQIVFYKVLEGGHAWPNGAFTWAGQGNTNRDINTNIEIWNFFKDFTNPFVNIALGKTIDVFPKYIQPQGDTLYLTANITNPAAHSVSVFAYIKRVGHDYQDSVQLFDYGLRGDGVISDNIFWGTKYLNGLEEDNYFVELKTYDLNAGTSQLCPLRSQFTTTGPLTVDSIVSTAISNFRYSIKPYIRNNGTQTQIENITIRLICNDPWATTVYPNQRPCPDLAPGQIAGLSQLFAVTYDSATFPGYFNLKFNILSDNVLYWSDSTNIVVGVEDAETLPTEYALSQNYPNPFNPTTTIKYALPQRSDVVVKIYNVLGKEVKTLIKDEQEAGVYEVEFNASTLSSGVYFYQLRAGNYVETKKMILIK
jgi:polyhydroxybutyrate depolymerase